MLAAPKKTSTCVTESLVDHVDLYHYIMTHMVRRVAVLGPAELIWP